MMPVRSVVPKCLVLHYFPIYNHVGKLTYIRHCLMHSNVGTQKMNKTCGLGMIKPRCKICTINIAAI